jgi:hypothetical protein
MELKEDNPLPPVAPLQILFRSPLALVKEQLQSMTEFAQETIFIPGAESVHNGNAIQQGCLGYDLEWSEHVPDFSGYRAIFFDPQLSKMQTILSLSLGAHLAGGERIAPIAQAFLACGAKLAAFLSADAVVWNPARLVSEPGFFVETVNDYVAGGAFPVLAAVDFEYQDNEYRLQSQGLAWFSGQEIALAGAGAHGQDLARRAVRLIHDIAVNGPVMTHQYVDDLDDDLQIELIPAGDANAVLNCHIHSKSDAKGKALTLH